MAAAARKVRPGTLAALAAFVVAVGALAGFRVAFQPFWIPSGSMKPALLTGDYLFVRRGGGMPERGDVVTFRDGASGAVFINRVIGLPGESVQMRGGQVVIDGVPVPQEDAGVFEEVYVRQGPMGGLPLCREATEIGGPCTKARLTETLPGGRRHDVLDLGPSRLDETPVFPVPEGHVFVLGDNRDNSIDSRVAAPMGRGFVPVEAITGRAARVVFSSRGALWNVALWRGDRFWEAVR